MPSRQATCPPPLTVLTVAALWVTLVRCGVAGSPGPGCDNGKVTYNMIPAEVTQLFLDRDLPADAVYWDCPGSTWPESSQTHPSVDTLYDPVPAMQICMDKSISYNHTIPNSGAYRPVRAESGEYLYCPPQRWLNNLHHGAAVLLYHPCAALRERLLLSALARSCLPDHIVTSHPRLSEHTPIAFVSWGHTLELPTAASPDVYGWLETSASTRRKEVVGGSRSRKYNLLLTRSAEQHGQQHAPPEEQTEESLRRCFERTISSQLNGELESNMKRDLKPMKERGQRRRMRAAIKEIPENEREDTITNRTTTISRTGDVQNNNFTLGASTDSPPGSRTPSDPPGSEIQNTDQGLTSWPTTPLGTNMSRTTLTGDSQQPSPKHTDTINPLSEGVNREHSKTARPGDEDEGTASVKQRDEGFVKHSLKDNASKANIFDEDNTAGGSRRDNEVVDVKERELEHKTTHSDTHSHQKSDKNAVDPISKSQSEPQPHQNPPNSPDCDGCNEDSDAVNTGLPRTPRTDEAVWAAAALGFLLILLTLSVLHTRLYRHWRTTPSLYWRNPQQDYDSVADVIRRRLRIANKRGKRGRRRECVLLPSSSSSDEHP